MMATFYTFKDKKEGTHVKNPGDVDGQQFDIGDCENCTLVIMDHCEQVQIDMLKNCRVFVGACASSIFIRNCENCVFYTSCRQLRLREVVNSTFYIYSMAEVHIEYSNAVRFAPFNGGYPDHARHMQTANLDPKVRRCRRRGQWVCCQWHGPAVVDAHVPPHVPLPSDAPSHHQHNLWYDIFDHNDPAKTHENWALVPEVHTRAPAEPHYLIGSI